MVVHRALDVPPFGLAEDDRFIEIDTGMLRLRYEKGTGRFAAGNLAILVRRENGPVTWNPGDAQKANLGGTYRTLDRYDGDTWQDGSTLPLEDGLIARDGWHVVDDTEGFGLDDDGWVEDRPAGDRQDLYFFGYGHDYRAALADFAAIAGPQPIPPRFVFGYWWSRYWNYSDEELRTLGARFEKERIPLDVLVLDMDWHTTPGLSLRPGHEQKDVFGEASGWTGYTFNRSLFPEPGAFMRWAHGQNLRVTLNPAPRLGRHAARGKLRSDGEGLVVGYLHPGAHSVRGHVAAVHARLVRHDPEATGGAGRGFLVAGLATVARIEGTPRPVEHLVAQPCVLHRDAARRRSPRPHLPPLGWPG